MTTPGPAESSTSGNSHRGRLRLAQTRSSQSVLYGRVAIAFHLMMQLNSARQSDPESKCLSTRESQNVRMSLWGPCSSARRTASIRGLFRRKRETINTKLFCEAVALSALSSKSFRTLFRPINRRPSCQQSATKHKCELAHGLRSEWPGTMPNWPDQSAWGKKVSLWRPQGLEVDDRNMAPFMQLLLTHIGTSASLSCYTQERTCTASRTGKQLILMEITVQVKPTNRQVTTAKKIGPRGVEYLLFWEQT